MSKRLQNQLHRALIKRGARYDADKREYTFPNATEVRGVKTETTTTYEVCRQCDTVLHPGIDDRCPECGGDDYYLWHCEGALTFPERDE